MHLSYEMEADWILLTTCNFRCDYCFIAPKKLGARMARFGTPAQWADGFNATGKTWLLHLTGGEPTIYPDFVNLCGELARNHYLSLNSNLSHRCIADFAEKIDPERVHFINAAVHYDERQKKASLNVFIERVQKLQANRFNVLVSVVMSPVMVSLFPEVSQHFESRGLFLVPKVMRGLYQGKRYPAAYTAGQKSLMLKYLARARQIYAPVSDRMGEPPTIDMFSDGRFFSSACDYRGKLCGSGHNFVKIEPDGTVVRCGSRKRLGNILQKNVSFLRAPKICDTAYCPYFCEKYTSPQFAGTPNEADASRVGLLSSTLMRLFGASRQ
jgi:MoaA/NifB/PqqE/SkfB family radical SAM enzyme